MFAFALLVIGCVTAAAVYVLAARDGSDGSSHERASPGAKTGRVVFQHLGDNAGASDYAKVATASLDRPNGRAALVNLKCERVYFAAGRGICLVPDLNPIESGYKIKLTGPDFKPRKELSIAGIPSRARISPDGRLGAATAFIAGHSYLDAGFSTRTVLIDMERGSIVADLEKDFTVVRGGEPFKKADFNFWGVTFTADGKGFYATLRTGETTYLVRADIDSRRAEILHENVECPSVSPDGTRIAYKRRQGNGWHLTVLDLESMRETPLAERQTVDDQAEWLDDEHVLYGLGRDIWVVRADGSGSPSKFISEGLSPAVIRSE